MQRPEADEGQQHARRARPSRRPCRRRSSAGSAPACADSRVASSQPVGHHGSILTGAVGSRGAASRRRRRRSAALLVLLVDGVRAPARPGRGAGRPGGRGGDPGDRRRRPPTSAVDAGAAAAPGGRRSWPRSWWSRDVCAPGACSRRRPARCATLGRGRPVAAARRRLPARPPLVTAALSLDATVVLLTPVVVGGRGGAARPPAPGASRLPADGELRLAAAAGLQPHQPAGAAATST